MVRGLFYTLWLWLHFVPWISMSQWIGILRYPSTHLHVQFLAIVSSCGTLWQLHLTALYILYIYIYVYRCINMCMYIYCIYIYIYVCIIRISILYAYCHGKWSFSTAEQEVLFEWQDSTPSSVAAPSNGRAHHPEQGATRRWEHSKSPWCVQSPCSVPGHQLIS